MYDALLILAELSKSKKSDERHQTETPEVPSSIHTGCNILLLEFL